MSAARRAPTAGRRPCGGAAVRAVALALALVLGAAPAQAGPVEDVARKAEAAHGRGEKALAEFVAEVEEIAWRSNEPEAQADVWLVADELLACGRAEVARALAGGVPRESGPDSFGAMLRLARSPGEAAARSALREAEALLERNRDDAEEAARRLAAVAAPGGSLLAARRAILRARALRAAGDPRGAADALEEAVEAGRALDWPWARWILGTRSADLAIQGRDPGGAAARLRRLEETPEAKSSPRERVEVYARVAMAATDAGTYDFARDAFARALASAEGLEEEDEGIASGLELNYAIALHRMGRYALAHGHYERALARLTRLREEAVASGGEPEAARWVANVSDAQNAFGALWFEIGQQDQALALYAAAEAGYRRAAEAAKASPHGAGVDRDSVAQGVAMAIANQAEVHAAQGDFEVAREKTEEAVRRFDAIRDAESAVATLGFLGDGEVAAGRLLEAARTWEEMRRRAQAASAKAGEAHARLGTAQARLGLARAAGVLLEPARAAKGRAATALARVLGGAAAREARQDLLGARGMASQAGDSLLVARILATTTEACLMADEVSEALAVASEAVREIERVTSAVQAADDVQARVRGRHLAAYVQGARAALRAGEVERAVWFMEASRAHALLRALGGTPTVTEALVRPDLRAELEQAKEERWRARAEYEKALAVPRTSGRHPSVDARRAAERAEASCKEREDRLRALEKRASELTVLSPSPMQDVRRWLEPGEAFVWFATLDDEVAAVVADGRGERAVDLGRLAPIAKACEALRETALGDDWRPRAKEVEDLVLRPLALGNDVTRIVVSPQGPLAWVPWRAVLDGAGRETDVALVPSAAVYAHLRAEPVRLGHGVLALGGCDYGTRYDAHAIAVHRQGRPFQDLPASGPEARDVANQPSDEVLLGARATIPAFRERLASGHARRRAVHFACHGEIHDADPMLSALAVTATTSDDGLLRANDILGLSIDADLAALSACSTGLDREVPGEGFFGLTRAFMAAGVPRVLASLWKADDEATSVLMREFYARFRTGTGASQALREAQAAVRKDPRWSPYRFWAGWVVWGLPN